MLEKAPIRLVVVMALAMPLGMVGAKAKRESWDRAVG